MRLLNRGYILQYKPSPDPRESGYEVDYLQSGKLTFDTFPDHLFKRDALNPQYAIDHHRSVFAKAA